MPSRARAALRGARRPPEARLATPKSQKKFAKSLDSIYESDSIRGRKEEEL